MCCDAGPMPDKRMPTVLASTRLTEVRGFSDFCSEFFQVSHTHQLTHFGCTNESHTSFAVHQPKHHWLARFQLSSASRQPAHLVSCLALNLHFSCKYLCAMEGSWQEWVPGVSSVADADLMGSRAALQSLSSTAQLVHQILLASSVHAQGSDIIHVISNPDGRMCLPVARSNPDSASGYRGHRFGARRHRRLGFRVAVLPKSLVASDNGRPICRL